MISEKRYELPQEGQEQSRDQWLPRQAGHTGLKFTNGLELSHDAASRATDRFTCPLACTFTADGVEVKTDGEYSPQAIAAILSPTAKPQPKKGQPLKFGNRTAVSHSDESRACADYANKCDKGHITVPGLTAVFTSVSGTRVEGIQPSRAKLSRLFKAGV